VVLKVTDLTSLLKRTSPQTNSRRKGSVAFLTSLLLCSAIEFILVSHIVETQGTFNYAALNYAEAANSMDVDAIRDHVRYLSDLGCRTPGYLGYQKAASYIYKSFVDNGLEPASYGYFENFTVLVPIVQEAAIQVLTPTVIAFDNISAMYPMGLNLGRTPPEGIEGRLVYIGKASLHELDGKDLNGSIVLVDYENSGNWIRSVMFGAKAVVFIEPRKYDSVQCSLNSRLSDAPQLVFRVGANHLGIPMNIPRLVLPEEDAQTLINLLSSGDVTLRVRIKASWEEKQASNIIGVIPGKKEEAVVLSAYYDSQSYVVGRAPGADQAIGIATLMELAAYFRANPPERTIWFLALGSHYGGLKGAREFVERHFMDVSGKIGMWVNLDLVSDMSDVGIFFAGYYYYFEASLLRFTWLRDRLFGSPSDVQDILGQLNIGITVENGLRVRVWRTYLPSDLIFDHEPYVLAGGVGITVATTNSFRTLSSTPSETYENTLGLPKRFENTRKQAKFVASLTLSLVNGPEFRNRGLGPTRYASQPNAGGFITLTGKVVRYDYTKGWFEKVAHALVSVRASHVGGAEVAGAGVSIGGSHSPRFYSLCRADENGIFVVRGLPSETTYTGAHQLGVGVAEVATPNIVVEAFVFDEKGEIVYAPELWQQRSDIYPISFRVDSGRIGSPDAPRYFPVFPCGTLVFFNLIPPVNSLGGISILDSRGHTPPTSYGYVRDSLIEGEDINMVFVPENVPIEVIIYSPEMPFPQGALTNASSKRPEGDGFSVNLGETRMVLATTFGLVTDFHLLDRQRLDVTSRYMATSTSALQFSDMANRLLIEAAQYSSADGGFNYTRSIYAFYAAWQGEINAYEFTRRLIFEIISSTLFFFILLIPFSILFVEFAFPQKSGLRRVAYACGVFAFFTSLLYLFHPGFHLATNIYIMLVGIAIIVFVMPVVGILWGRILNFIKAFRKEIVGKHFAEISRFSAILMSFSMGISNMRKRKLRTALTITTIILITFSLISLTSIYTISIVRTIPSPGETYYNGIMISEFRYLPLHLENFLKMEIGNESTICPRSWIYTSSGFASMLGGQIAGTEIKVIGPADSRGEPTYFFSALLALAPEDPIFDQRVSMTNYTGSMSAIVGTHACMIPQEAAERCGWEIGDVLYVGGYNLTIVGVFNSAILNSLVDLDQQEVTPINWGVQWAGGVQHILSQSVLIVPYSLAEKWGYPPMQVVAKFSNSSRVFSVAQDLSNKLPFVVYAGREGRKADFQQQAWFSLRGMEQLALPLAIAILVIFNAMLASVYERKSEISTCSSLGLSPLHVAGLFLSETFVYSVIAAVFGYIAGLMGTNFLYTLKLMPTDFYPNFSSMTVIITVSISMLTTIASSAYPVVKASRLVTPSVERVWKLRTKPHGDNWDIPLPFTSSAEETDGVMLFLIEFFEAFTTAEVGAFRTDYLTSSESVEGTLVKKEIIVDTTLPPFDMGVSQSVHVVAHKQIHEANYKYAVQLVRKSGALYMWQKAVYRFVDSLRKQLLIWRTLPAADKLEIMERDRKSKEKPPRG